MTSHEIAPEDALPPRSLWPAVRRGLFGRCPNCGRGRMFRAFLKVAERCPVCGEALHHHRADDAPAYFVILIVGHLVVPLALATEVAFAPPYWVHAVLWLPLTVGLADRPAAAGQGRNRRLAMGELHARLRSARRGRCGCREGGDAGRAESGIDGRSRRARRCIRMTTDITARLAEFLAIGDFQPEHSRRAHPRRRHDDRDRPQRTGRDGAAGAPPSWPRFHARQIRISGRPGRGHGPPHERGDAARSPASRRG